MIATNAIVLFLYKNDSATQSFCQAIAVHALSLSIAVKS